MEELSLTDFRDIFASSTYFTQVILLGGCGALICILIWQLLGRWNARSIDNLDFPDLYLSQALNLLKRASDFARLDFSDGRRLVEMLGKRQIPIWGTDAEGFNFSPLPKSVYRSIRDGRYILKDIEEEIMGQEMQDLVIYDKIKSTVRYKHLMINRYELGKFGIDRSRLEKLN